MAALTGRSCQDRPTAGKRALRLDRRAALERIQIYRDTGEDIAAERVIELREGIAIAVTAGAGGAAGDDRWFLIENVVHPQTQHVIATGRNQRRQVEKAPGTDLGDKGTVEI